MSGSGGTSAVKRFGLSAYRRWKFWIEPERMRMLRAVRAWLSDGTHPAATIVEVGAGTGFMKSVVRKDLPASVYVGGDIAPTEASDVVFDAASMPFGDASVDVVLALEVLEHMSSPQQLIDESARVLRPGGRLILTVPFMFGIHDYRDYYRYTPLGLETMLGQSGMSLVEVKPRGGTFVASTGLVRNLILNAIVGNPKDWRAVGAGKQVRWLIATAVLTPWTLVTWAAFGLDALLDRRTVSPPGFFFLCSRDAAA